MPAAVMFFCDPKTVMKTENHFIIHS